MKLSKKQILSKYRAVIFDLDGTLYFQTKLRMMMACRLVGYYCTHFWRLKELLAIRKFRKVRERWDELAVGKTELQLDEAQYSYVGREMKMPPERVQAAVEKWMYEKPLTILPECRDEALVDLINAIHVKGIPVMIYSDYPVTDKLRALDIKADKQYSALDESIMSLKPDPKGLRVIMEENHFQPSEIIMIGDRMSKDGQAAINAGTDYIILEKSATAREKLYAELLRELDQ
ncbi:MAG: HAD family hydrolase [bacterium]|nr:HAD family hydrolase [bacterium]